MKIKTIDNLKKEGWTFIPEMSLFENEKQKLPNGSTVVLSIGMMNLFESLTTEESQFLQNTFRVANALFFKNYWWHRSMFEGLAESCQHSWVDVGFSHPKLICKQCDLEKDVQ